MPVPLSQMATVAGYVLKQKLARRERYPLVLMLEPLYRCNLACAGCGKIQYPSNVLKAQLSVAECLRAVDECGAPIVSIPGGEPLLHPQIGELAAALVARRKYVYLCTNALLLEEKLPLFQPSKYLSFSVHLDGLAEEHDRSVCRDGTFETATRAIRAALARGFRVTTNTTLFEGADPERTAAFFDEAMRLGVEGMMVSPGYAYEKAPDREHFLARERTVQLFRRIFAAGGARRKQWRFNQSPLFLEFLLGARDYECTPWAMPSYGVFGWQKPCYLLQDGYAQSYHELLGATEWRRYGRASGNPACRDCMVHSGFEATSVDHAFSSLRGLAAMARATLFGVAAPAPGSMPPRAVPAAAAPDAAPTRGWSADASPAALRAAFEYRGDVTLELEGGESAEGYVTDVGPSALRLWTRGSTAVREIPVARVRRIALTGRDPAAGKSFETWKQRQAHAEAAPAAS
ncbi:MAG: adenosyl-hopene transferase HpnH [Proteobacteria bacterium]|nr:MAG: adenosyl-hopene transferase HpnH [Pseudomonadota bacterium]